MHKRKANVGIGPLEFTERHALPPVRDLVGGGPFNLKPGEWTDDTSMALCLTDSLIACGGFDEDDLMERFVRWLRQGENSVTGVCFDIGITTRQALLRFEETGRSARHRPEDIWQAGNGTLMRMAPAAIFAAPDHLSAMDLAEAQSRATHPAPIAHEACRFFSMLLVEAMTGGGKAAVLRSRPWRSDFVEIRAIAEGSWKMKSRDEISSSGYVISTLEAALWCVDRTDSFEDAVVAAANLADDADTVAAVTGQMAGALYGVNAIPARWLEKLAWRDHILERADALLADKKA